MQGLQEAPRRAALQGLPGDARQDGRGDRRGRDFHAGPHPLRRRHGGDGARQARLRAEAARAQHLAVPHPAEGGAALQGDHPDGQPGPHLRGHAPDQGVGGRRHRRRRDGGRSPGPTGRTRRGSFPPTTLPAAHRAARPATLDWDLWQGPVAAREYSADYVPVRWRGWWDYGCGSLGDIGCHTFDAPFWVLDLGSPTKVEASGSRRPERASSR